MGYIKDPSGIDLLIGPSILTDEDKQAFAEALATYQATHPRIAQGSPAEAYQAHVSNEPKPVTAS